MRGAKIPHWSPLEIQLSSSMGRDDAMKQIELSARVDQNSTPSERRALPRPQDFFCGEVKQGGKGSLSWQAACELFCKRDRPEEERPGVGGSKDVEERRPSYQHLPENAPAPLVIHGSWIIMAFLHPNDHMSMDVLYSVAPMISSGDLRANVIAVENFKHHYL
eukprot:83939-Hanusia_phi.AAC.13